MILPGVIASSGGVASSFESIATTTVGSGGSASITFSSIPQTFAHLQIRAFTSNSVNKDMYMEFNGDTSTSYDRHYLLGDGSGAGAGNQLLSQSAGYTSSTSGQFGVQIIDVFNYTNTSTYKTSRLLTGFDNNGSGAVVLYSGLWRATPAAITSIKIYPVTGVVNQYSSFALYGVKA